MKTQSKRNAMIEIGGFDMKIPRMIGDLRGPYTRWIENLASADY